MNCMKCGREIRSEQVFCEECLLDMAKYPVKPGTAVQLPHRSENPAVKKTTPRRRSALSPEEQIKKLKRRVLALTLALILALAAAAALGYPAVTHLLEEDFLPGQNYSAVDSATPPEESEPTEPAPQ